VINKTCSRSLTSTYNINYTYAINAIKKINRSTALVLIIKRDYAVTMYLQIKYDDDDDDDMLL